MLNRSDSSSGRQALRRTPAAARPAADSPASAAAFDEAVQVLSSPLSFSGIDDWRKSVTRILTPLLGADRAIFGLTAPGIERLFSSDYSRDILDAYVHRYHAADPTRMRVARLGLEVWSLALVWGDELEQLERSDIHRDFLIPNGVWDAMGMTLELPELGSRASLTLHSGRRGSPAFGEAGLSLMRALLPPFQIGAAAAVRLLHRRDSFARYLDSLSEGIRIYDTAGAIVHQNRGFSALLDQESAAVPIEEAAARLAHELSERHLHPESHAEPHPSSAFIRRIDGESREYEIRGFITGRGLLTDDASISISLRPVQLQHTVSDRLLRERYGLTSREVQIARLLAQGQSNKGIAEASGISLHTVRRHTEKIFTKLGVNARAQIATKLRGHMTTPRGHRHWPA